MANDAPIRWTDPTRETALLLGEVGTPVVLAAAPGYLRSREVTNSLKEREASCVLTLTKNGGTAPSEDTIIEIYVLYNYPSGAVDGFTGTTAPNTGLVGSVSVRQVDTQTLDCRGIPLKPFPYVVYLRSSLDQPVNVVCAWYTYSEVQST